MVADRLGAELQLGQAHLVLGAVVLKVREVLAGAAQGNLEGLDAGLEFVAAHAEFQDAGLGLGALLLPALDALGQAGGLGFERADALLLGGDVALACGNNLGKFADAGLHRGALAGQRLLALALGGHAQARLGKVAGGLGLGVTQEGDPRGGRVALLPGGRKFQRGALELLLALGDLGFELADVFLQGGDLAVERLVAVTGVLELAGGEQVVGLGGGKKSLRVAEMLACLAEADHRGLQRGEGTLAD